MSRITLQSTSATSSLFPTMHAMWSLTNNIYVTISYSLKGLIVFCVDSTLHTNSLWFILVVMYIEFHVSHSKHKFFLRKTTIAYSWNLHFTPFEHKQINFQCHYRWDFLLFLFSTDRILKADKCCRRDIVIKSFNL